MAFPTERGGPHINLQIQLVGTALLVLRRFLPALLVWLDG